MIGLDVEFFTRLLNNYNRLLLDYNKNLVKTYFE
jgi:hypothetical protein